MVLPQMVYTHTHTHMEHIFNDRQTDGRMNGYTLRRKVSI